MDVLLDGSSGRRFFALWMVTFRDSSIILAWDPGERHLGSQSRRANPLLAVIPQIEIKLKQIGK